MERREKICPDCNVELEWARAKDIDTGDILITTEVVYCPKCLDIQNYEVRISH